MQRLIPLILLLAALAVPAAAQAAQQGTPATPAAAEKPPDADSYFQQQLPKFRAATDPVEKFGLYKDFLTKFPEHRYSPNLLDAAWESAREMKKPDEFFSLAAAVIPAAKAPDMQRGLKVVLVKAFADTGQIDKVKALTAEITAMPDVRFGTYSALFPILADAKLWAEIADCVARATPLATAETIQKDFPNRKFTPAELERRANDRKATLLVAGGWAKANSGARPDALKNFQAADGLIMRNFMGVSMNPLDLYWGRTLLLDGQYDAAIDRLARPTLFGGEAQYRETLQEAYLKKGGDAAGLDAYLDSIRPKYARAMADFTLPGYDGKELQFASAAKGKVVLLAFWFPT